MFFHCNGMLLQNHRRKQVEKFPLNYINIDFLVICMGICFLPADIVAINIVLKMRYIFLKSFQLYSESKDLY